MLRGALRSGASGANDVATGEEHALERALFWGRCLGGAIIIVLGPPAVSAVTPLFFYALGAYFLAYSSYTLWLTRRASTERERRRAEMVAHIFDTGGFIGGLVLSATAPGWLVTNAAALYIVIATARFGATGATTAVVAISIAHVAIALWRQGALGVPFAAADTLVHIGIYVLAGLITVGIERELRALRARREVQVSVHEPLLQAHNDLRQGVLITEGERAVYVSDGFIALTGWTREEVMALPSVYELIPEHERSEARERTAGLPAEGGLLQKSLRRRDGEPIEVEVAIQRFHVDGAARTVAIVRDVTMRARAVAELERAQRLESLGALAGGIAHDFNNLLAVIMNNAHLALTAPEGSSNTREIEEIREAAERGTQLTRQMLVFSKGGLPRGEAVDIKREVSYAQRLLKRAIGADVSLDVRVAERLPSVRLEAGQVEQILMNLAVNARDAMPEGGRLSISVDAVDIDVATAESLPRLEPGRHIRIVVQDNGTGMPPDIAGRAFEPFFSTKPKGRGTGLGLSTVYGIVRRGGGHIGLASTPGAGTRITIHLPAAVDAVATPASVNGATSPDGSGEHVLLVDDEPSIRRVTAKFLTDAGYRVTEAGTPSEAIVAATRGLDVLVTDVVLPEIDGRELAGRLRAERPGLPVVLISGYAPGGPSPVPDPALLAKPFTPDALLARVREALRPTVGVS